MLETTPRDTSRRRWNNTPPVVFSPLRSGTHGPSSKSLVTVVMATFSSATTESRCVTATPILGTLVVMTDTFEQNKRFLGPLVSDCIRQVYFHNGGHGHHPSTKELFRPISKYMLASVCATIHWYCVEWTKPHSGNRYRKTNQPKDDIINMHAVQGIFEGKMAALATLGTRTPVILDKLTSVVLRGIENTMAEYVYRPPHDISLYANSLEGLDFDILQPRKRLRTLDSNVSSPGPQQVGSHRWDDTDNNVPSVSLQRVEPRSEDSENNVSTTPCLQEVGVRDTEANENSKSSLII